MSRLDEAVNSVPADSLPADESSQNSTPDLEANPKPEGDKGDKGDKPDKESDGRTVENVHGEFTRKLEKSNAALDEMRAELNALKDKHRVPETPKPTTPTLEQATSADLEAMLPHVDDAQKVSLRELITERKVDERVAATLSQYTTQTEFKQREQRFNEQAITRWPDLRKKGTDFYTTTQRILNDMGNSADTNPRAVLDAANEAGVTLGTAPATGAPQITRRAADPNGVVGGHASRTPGASPEGTTLEQAREIGKKLANAMPDRKFTDAQLKQIAVRSDEYKKHIGAFTRG